MNSKLIGGIVIVVVVVAVVAVGARNRGGDDNGGAPDVEDTGGFFEGGSMDGDPQANCEAACDVLDKQIKDLKDARMKELFEGAGCSEGSGGDWTGTVAGGYQFTCPDQTSAESLGEALADWKDNPSAKDKEIEKLEDEHEANCPCQDPVPAGMVRIAPPYLIICADGTSLSGSPKADENGEPILDANGNYIDSVTGQSVVCP